MLLLMTPYILQLIIYVNVQNNRYQLLSVFLKGKKSYIYLSTYQENQLFKFTLSWLDLKVNKLTKIDQSCDDITFEDRGELVDRSRFN